jgi:DNA helicase-2/ATP-dependent DNA helicase PcrA
MRLALAISPNDELVPIERHGEAPQLVFCKRPAEATACIVAEIKDFLGSSHHSLAIIAKTQKQAERLHRYLVEADMKARLLDAASVGFSTGVVVCTAHLAKGLEFDRVIVADASAENYRTEMDRNLLYVACTRAMHRLTVIAVGVLSGLLPASVAA